MTIRSVLRFVILMAVATSTAITTTATTSSNRDSNELVLPNDNVEESSNELALFDADAVDFEGDERELSTVSSTIGNAVCPLVRAFFLFLVECVCDAPIFKLRFDVACSRYLCSPLGLVCSAVNFTSTFKAILPSVESAVCVDKISLFNDNFPTFGPFCIGFDTSLLRNDCPRGLPNCLKSGRAAKVKKLNYAVSGCEVELGGEICASCTPCDQTGSVIFDCTNVLDGFKIDQCAQFSPWLGPGSRSTATLPRLELAKS